MHCVVVLSVSNHSHVPVAENVVGAHRFYAFHWRGVHAWDCVEEGQGFGVNKLNTLDRLGLI